MKKLFNIDQEEKKRILEMHENATKRYYLSEQMEDPTKPTFVDAQGTKYFIPNLENSKFNDFVSFNEFDTLKSKLNMLSSLGVKANLQNNPLAVPQETIDSQIAQFTNKFKETGDRDAAMKGLSILPNIEFLEGLLSNSLEVYLKQWRPNNKGINLINNVAFQNNPSIKSAKQFISNFDEVFPRVVDIKTKKTGLNLA